MSPLNTFFSHFPKPLSVVAVGRAGDSLFKSLGLASTPPGAAPTGTQSGKAPAYTENFTKHDFGRFFDLDMVSDPFHV